MQQSRVPSIFQRDLARVSLIGFTFDFTYVAIPIFRRVKGR